MCNRRTQAQRFRRSSGAGRTYRPPHATEGAHHGRSTVGEVSRLRWPSEVFGRAFGNEDLADMPQPRLHLATEEDPPPVGRNLSVTPAKFVTDVIISPSAPGSPFEASASVLCGGIRLSGFRLMANVDRSFSVVWSERRAADEHAVGLAPRGVPWAECREAILEAYRRRAYAN